jgi:hypothetical protein
MIRLRTFTLLLTLALLSGCGILHSEVTSALGIQLPAQPV